MDRFPKEPPPLCLPPERDVTPTHSALSLFSSCPTALCMAPSSWALLHVAPCCSPWSSCMTAVSKSKAEICWMPASVHYPIVVIKATQGKMGFFWLMAGGGSLWWGRHNSRILKLLGTLLPQAGSKERYMLILILLSPF